ncbi:MAG: hypothetical protein WCG75_09030, partial [Armatimonadota bacterium]
MTNSPQRTGKLLLGINRLAVAAIVLVVLVVAVGLGCARPTNTALLNELRSQARSRTTTHHFVKSFKQTVSGETFLVSSQVSAIELIADKYCKSPEWTKSNSGDFLAYNAKEPNNIDFIAVTMNTDQGHSPEEITRINIQYRRSDFD